LIWSNSLLASLFEHVVAVAFIGTAAKFGAKLRIQQMAVMIGTMDFTVTLDTIVGCPNPVMRNLVERW
jgi:hypothetical protein